MTDAAADAALITAIGSLLAAIVALIGVLWQGARTRAGLERVANDTAATNHQVSPNHGGSMRDAVDRIEAGLAAGLERLWRADERRAATADRVHREIFTRLDRLEELDAGARLARLETRLELGDQLRDGRGGA